MISRLIAKRDELFSARPHVPLVIEPDPARKLALAMSLADVCSCLADEDISRGHPIKLLVRIIFSAPVRRRHRAVGGPFYARSGRLSRRRIRQMAHRNRENSGESQWTLSVSSSPGHHAGASHAPGAAATSISAPMRRHHSPAGGFPVQDAGRARVARQASPDEFVHVMQLTSKKR